MDLDTFCWKRGKGVASYNALIARKCPIIWICTNFVGNQEKMVASYNALITRMLKCPIMDLYIFYWKPGKRVTSYNALIEGAVYIHLETRKVLVMHLIMLSSRDA